MRNDSTLNNSRQGSARRLNRSTISQRSRSATSVQSGNSQNSKKSLNAEKRKREMKAISQDNLRFVANLVNIKPVVPITSSKEYQD